MLRRTILKMIPAVFLPKVSEKPVVCIAEVEFYKNWANGLSYCRTIKCGDVMEEITKKRGYGSFYLRHEIYKDHIIVKFERIPDAGPDITNS